METKTIKAYGTESATTPLHSLEIRRRALLPNDVKYRFVTDMKANRCKAGSCENKGFKR